MIRRHLLYALLVLALLLAFVAPMTASAAHCTDNGGAGNSDFATHVRTVSGSGGHNEGDHRGWSTCEYNSANYAP